VLWEGEPLEEIGLDLRGKIVVGKFVDRERETFRERLQKYWPAWPSNPGPPSATPSPSQEEAKALRRGKPIERLEVRIAGAGGQGIMLAGTLLGAAAAVHEQRHAVTIPSYGPESRGGASKSDIVISDDLVEYPRVSHPNILVITFQEAYEKYKQPRAEGCILITEEDLVKLDEEDEAIAWTVPALRWAREMGEERVFNMIMLGFTTAITDAVSAEAMKMAIRNRLRRLTELNLKAFERGYEYGLSKLAERGGT